jgi:hypothetical protein
MKAETTRLPEGLGFGGADVHAESFAPPIAVDANRNDHGDRDNVAVLAHLHVGGVDPQIGASRLRSAAEDGLHFLVDFGAQPAHLALGDAAYLRAPDDRDQPFRLIATSRSN